MASTILKVTIEHKDKMFQGHSGKLVGENVVQRLASQTPG
jgi:hypothetical protein